VGVSLNDIEDFKNIFNGNTDAYGVFIPSTITEGKKVEGRASTQSSQVETYLYEEHLLGHQGLGIIPIRKDGSCVFSVIDIDKYDSDHKDIIRAIYKYNLPLVPFRSKSGGLHLYLFLSTAIQASQVLKVMVYLRDLFSLKKDTEIFPKQSMLKEGDKGNWINLPYFNMESTAQFLIKEDFTSATLSEAIQIIKEKSLSYDSFKTVTEGIPLNDAPPCLQSLYILGNVTKDRNLYLFSLARYYKAKEGDDFERFVTEANNELKNPLPIEELLNTVIKTHKKKNYSYKCKEEPICSICNKNECKNRKYGIGSGEVSEISYEEFIQYGTEEPWYEWIVNGQTLTFLSEYDIINQAKFRELCLRKIHVLPFKVSEFAWTEIVNTALKNVIIKDEEEKAGMVMSTVQLFREYLVEFLTKRAPAETKEQVLVDRVYKDEKEGGYVFKAKNLHVFLIQQKQFRSYGFQELNQKLKSLGAYPKQYYVAEKKTSLRAWIIPFKGLEKYIEDTPNDITVDFLDKIEEKDF
jgi:hypothetical protein